MILSEFIYTNLLKVTEVEETKLIPNMLNGKNLHLILPEENLQQLLLNYMKMKVYRHLSEI